MLVLVCEERNRGQSLTLFCDFIFSTSIATNFRRRSVLVIRHARSEDSATYECRAQGAVGPPAIASANVSVLPPVTAAPDDSSEYLLYYFALLLPEYVACSGTYKLEVEVTDDSKILGCFISCLRVSTRLDTRAR